MRWAAALALVLGTAAVARAEAVPIAIAPFAGRCFDAGQLATRVRERLDVPVTVGAPPRGGHEEVRLGEHDGAVTVAVTARNRRGEVVGSAQRIIPADTDCATALELASLIVARAALPLNFESTGNSRRSTVRRHPKPTAPPPPPPSPTPTPAPAPTPAPPPPPPPKVIIIEKRVPVPVPVPTVDRRLSTVDSTGTIVLRTRGPDRRWVGELAAAVYGGFPLDGTAADVAGGELAVGFRHRRFGLSLRAAVEQDYTVKAVSSAGPFSVDLRRAVVALMAHADVPVRVGALRFAVGPAMPLWTVRPSGLPGAHTSVIVSAAVTARILYHLDIGRVFLSVGADASVAFIREQLQVTGVGTIARTPIVQLGPILGFGVNL